MRQEKKGFELPSETSPPVIFRATTLDSESQETPNHEQWLLVLVCQLERIPEGSETEFLNSRRIVFSGSTFPETEEKAHNKRKIKALTNMPHSIFSGNGDW